MALAVELERIEVAGQARDGVFSREQAERLARLGARAAGDALVTKADLEAATAAIRTEIALLRKDVETNTALLRQEFDAKLQAMAKELVKWFAGIMLAHGIAVAGLTVTLVKLL